MKTLDKIREDLKEIRYYYSRQHYFDEAAKKVGTSTVLDKVHRYNMAICSAPPLLYDLYTGLYVRNLTQESLSAEMYYTPEYIRMQNKNLVLYLQTKI